MSFFPLILPAILIVLLAACASAPAPQRSYQDCVKVQPPQKRVDVSRQVSELQSGDVEREKSATRELAKIGPPAVDAVSAITSSLFRSGKISFAMPGSYEDEAYKALAAIAGENLVATAYQMLTIGLSAPPNERNSLDMAAALTGTMMLTYGNSSAVPCVCRVISEDRNQRIQSIFLGSLQVLGTNDETLASHRGLILQTLQQARQNAELKARAAQIEGLILKQAK